MLSVTGGQAIAHEAAGAAPPRLALPVACTLGATCWIQHYVDRDPSPGARDYACGSLTYQGHNGTDIRIADMAAQRAGVNVLAAADGVVRRLRDGMADVSVRSTGLAAVDGVECGNGLVVDHGGGWETQYCHLARGSLQVKPGERVTSGQPLGRIGLSVQTEFPHLHLTVRHDGRVVDPFSTEPAAACGAGRSLWAQTPPYVPRMIVNVGFASGPIDNAAVEAGAVPRPAADTPYLVPFVRVVGLRKGDAPVLTLSAPDGAVLAPSPAAPLDADADQRLIFVGKRRPPGGWKPGPYRAHYEVKAGGRLVLQRDFAVTLVP